MKRTFIRVGLLAFLAFELWRFEAVISALAPAWWRRVSANADAILAMPPSAAAVSISVALVALIIQTAAAVWLIRLVRRGLSRFRTSG